MTDVAPDRIKCLNPRCRRTAARAKYPDCTDIICQKCWKVVPQHLRDTNRRLDLRERRVLRQIERRVAAGTIARRTILSLQMSFRCRREDNWDAIRKYFTEPEAPIGLEGFLKEIGL